MPRRRRGAVAVEAETERGLVMRLLLHSPKDMVAGALAFAAKLIRPLPRILSIDHKVRLIDDAGDADHNHSSLRDVVALLSARGLDARGVLLNGSAFSNEAIRHGAAYLGELVATAHRGAKSTERVAIRAAAGDCR